MKNNILKLTLSTAMVMSGFFILPDSQTIQAQESIQKEGPTHMISSDPRQCIEYPWDCGL